MAARTGVIVPVAGFALPDGLQASERLDLAAQPPPTRIAIVQLNSNGQQVRPGTQYRFSLHRGATVAAVPARSASLETAASERVESWLELFESLFALRAQHTEALLNDARARETTLLDALRALGATPRI